MTSEVNPTSSIKVEKEKRYSATAWLATGLIISLCVVNLMLIKQNFTLRRKLTLTAETRDASARSLRGGEILAGFAGTDLSGQPYTFDYKKDGRKHLLLFLSPTCPYCVQQAPLWRDVLNKVDSNRFSVLGFVDAKEDRQIVSAHAEELGYFKTTTPLPIVFLSGDALARYKLIATPTTLLISDAGKVEHVWVGKWDEGKVNEVAAALK